MSGKENAVDPTLAAAQREVNAAVSTMQQNMQSMAERDIQLSNLDGKTESFAATSAKFKQQSAHLHQKMLMQKYATFFLVAMLALEFLGYLFFPQYTTVLCVVLVAAYIGFEMYSR